MTLSETASNEEWVNIIGTTVKNQTKEVRRENYKEPVLRFKEIGIYLVNSRETKDFWSK